MKEEDKIELRSEEFQEILGSVPPWILRWGITVLAAVIIVLLIGSALFKYPDTISSQVTLTGSVPPAGVVARSSGKLINLFVSDNQEIKKGDYLAVIDNPANTKHILELKTHLNILNPENDSSLYLPPDNFNLGNLQSIYASFRTLLFEYMEYKRLVYYPQKIRMTQERISQYERQRSSLLRQEKIMQQQFSMYEKQLGTDSLFFGMDMLTSKEYNASKAQYLQGLLSMENISSSLTSMEIQIAQLKESLFDTDYQHVEKLNSLQSNLRSLLSQLTSEIQSWELNYVLKSPINGKVTFTNYWVINQNVSAGEEVFNIIPTGEFEIIGKALLPIARSGKVKVGQKVNIRIDNFPDQEFGILKGVVRNISLVPVKNGEMVGYVVEISLPDNLTTSYKRELPWLPNMQGEANIITEDISLLERFILPIKKILAENVE
ncbi:HlyD family secretion protein [Bacteroidales bacterium OttesenSCG-928-A17]|nr:HlyD family secretion protein [Bacteroidales bacterium OttesenSCG-928-A17]